MSKKNHKRKHKVATYALASALVLSNLAFVAPTSAATYRPGDLASKVQQLRQMEEQTAFKKTDANSVNARSNLKATDKVRVIVEVEGQTPVEYATKQGKLFKQLSEDTKSSLQSKAIGQQKTVKDKIQAKGVSINYKQHYTTAFNGFSGEVAYGDLSKIESTSGVKNVYLANEYNRPVDQKSAEPQMTKSHQFIQSKQTWNDLGFKGQGMVISIIDTGVDPSHRDFKVTDPSKDSLTADKVGSLVQKDSLPGKFYTDKVPYGYNYYDLNDTILDLGPSASMHGMHVAGTTAANGDESNGGIKGVAPEAQVLAMKVFSNDPSYRSTWSDIYLKAIDDSIKLGADVLNMSLGSVASFYDANSAEDLAITRAVDNGIVCSVSAGNSNQIGYGWSDPLSQNPDIGVVGAPGLDKDTICVAASGNEAYLYENAITLDGNASFNTVGKGIDDWTKLAASFGGNLPVVGLGKDSNGNYKLGTPDDYKGIDVKGKIVVVARGSITFADKTKNAAQAGAAGIIVWNATDGVQYADQGGWDIPIMLVNSKADGQALAEAIAAGQTTLHVQQTAKNESPEMGRITSFSSWGVTPSLELKPELTAPGGNIYSTVNNNQYEVMSGTSMAAPHVSGGSALVQQYLKSDKRFSQLSVSERTHLAKNLLMNTAHVINDVEGHPYSPRRQGAGMMQIENAVTTPVYFVNKSTGEAKVELKDFQSKQFSMTFTVKNISDKNVMYKVDTTALTDEFYQSPGFLDRNKMQTGKLEGAKFDAPDSVTIPAGQSVDFTVKVDLSNAKIPGFDKDGNKILADLHDNIFVEGSVNLRGSSGTPDLTAPYVGFYGKWDSPQIVDGFKDLGETRYFDLSKAYKGGHDMTRDGDNYFWGAVPGKNFYALSPNGDKYDDDINPLPSFLRNASEVQYNILDKDGNLLRRVNSAAAVEKNAYNNGKGDVMKDSENTIWDGKVGGKVVKDGLYYYEIKSVIGYDGAKWQSKKIPVYVDTTAPEVHATYDAKKKTVSWTAKDDGTGVKQIGIFVKGNDKPVAVLPGDATSYQFTDLPDKSIVQVVAMDYAGNGGGDTAAVGDVDLPTIYITDGTKDSKGGYVANSPAPYGAYNSKEVAVKGFVTDDLGVKAIKVNGKDVNFTVDANGHANYETSVTFDKDGAYDVVVQATDYSNKTTSVARHIYVDTTAPVIKVDAPERVDKKVDSVTLNVKLQDNFSYLNFYVNDNHEFEVPFTSPIDAFKQLNKEYKVTVPLQEGENKVVLRAIDIAGNETVQELTINRADEVKQGWVEEDGVTYYYDEDGSMHKGWLTLGEEDGWPTKFYFDLDTGAMQKGWLTLDGKRYHFNEYGNMETDYTYVPEDKNFYFFDENGVAQSGIQNLLGINLYLDANTGLLKSSWKYIDGTWYYAEEDGHLKTGWLQYKSQWYFFDKNSKMQTGWVNDGRNDYYLTSSGAMATGLTKIDGKLYYFDKDGHKVSGWVKDGRKWYYAKSGVVQTGWVKDGGSWYFLDKSGVMQTGWINDGGKWYYLEGTGAMKTGWLYWNNKWYYLNNSGDMATGWKQVNGKWYYFYASGDMAANTKVGGYKLGKDGAWIK